MHATVCTKIKVESKAASRQDQPQNVMSKFQLSQISSPNQRSVRVAAYHLHHCIIRFSLQAV